MKSRTRGALLLSATLTWVGCEDDSAPATPSAAASSAATAASASASAQPDKPAADASKTSPDGPLAKLPNGAAIYGTSDLSFVNAVFGLIPAGEKEKGIAMGEEMLGAKVTDAASLASALGIDPKRRLQFALVGPPHEGIEKLAEEYIAYTEEKQRAAAKAKLAAFDPPLFTYVRVIVPLAADNADKLVGAIEKVTDTKAVRCAKSDECKAMATKPDMLLIGRQIHVGVRVADAQATLDIVMAGQDEGERALKALSAFAENVGGAGSTRCQELTPAAEGTSFCIEPQVAANAGVASGLFLTLNAVGAKSITFEQAVKIAKVGREESLKSRTILQKKPEVFDDGTVTLRMEAETLKMRASWSVTDEGTKKLTKDFSTEQCATSGTGTVALFEKLQQALGITAAQTESEMWEEVNEAGWGAYPVLVGKSWPAYLPFIIKQSKAAAETFKGKTCFQLEGGRFRLESNTAFPKELFQ